MTRLHHVGGPVRRIELDRYLIDYYGYHAADLHSRLAVIVLNRNLPEVTDRLCEANQSNTNCPIDLFVTESGSDPDRLSRYCSFHFVDSFSRDIGLRIARGLNASLALIERLVTQSYDAFWFVTNDVSLVDASDYVAEAVRILDRFPRIGILEHPDDLDETYVLNYVGSEDRVCCIRLHSPFQYPISLQSNRVSITPFAIIRSIILRRELIMALGPPLDESNWRNWGNDEDLAMRTWKNGWWIAMMPYSRIREDMFLTTRRSIETRTEDVDTFRAQAERDLHAFVARKYQSSTVELRSHLAEEMISHLKSFSRHGLDIAHCMTNRGNYIQQLIC